MAKYGTYRGRQSYRRKLGYTNAYASTFGMRPVPQFRKRKAPPGGGATLRLGRRVRPRLALPNSLTKTLTRRKKRPGNVTKYGDNASASVNTIGKKWLTQFERMMSRKVVSPQSVFQNSTGNMSSTSGKQFARVFDFMIKPDLTAMETAANGGTSAAVPVRYFLKVGKMRLRMKNQSNGVAKMSIYDIVTKVTPPSTALDNPLECWTKGVTDFGYATATTTVGQVPQKSPEFNQYFSVNRVTTLNLEPGQEHEHTVYHRYNRIVDSIRFQNSVSLSLAGLTRFVLVVFHGSLGHESATPATVTYMPVTVDWAYSSEYTYGWIDKTQKSYAITDNNPTVIADYDFMAEGGDVDGNNINA